MHYLHHYSKELSLNLIIFVNNIKAGIPLRPLYSCKSNFIFILNFKASWFQVL